MPRDFPGGPVVKNRLPMQGDVGSIPGQGTKIPHAVGQISPRITTTELMHLNKRACVWQTTEPMCSGPHTPQLQSPGALKPSRHNQREKTYTPQLERRPRATTKSPCATTKSPHTSTKTPHVATKTQCSKKKKKKKKKKERHAQKTHKKCKQYFKMS